MSGERKPVRQSSPIVVIVVLALCLFMGNDVVVISTAPMKYLDIPIPHLLEHTQSIGLAIALAVWLGFRRSWPNLSAILAVYLCLMAPFVLLKWTNIQVDKVKIKTEIGRDDFSISALESRLGFKICEHGDSTGEELWIRRDPAHEAELVNETKRLKIYRPG
jgi:hypothetical protein